jgi:DNA-binding MarR family transcriptional regulator
VNNKQHELTQRLMEAFFRFRHVHRKSPVSGMKHSEVRMLHIINKHRRETGRGVKISELSRILQVTSPTITQLTNGLEERGLVERSNDPADRRVIYVQLTEAGEAVLKQVSAAYFDRFSRLVQHLGAEKSKQLADLLTECLAFMRADAEKNG